MKNTIKMSLVAAVAVAGLTTSASAGNLEEMIKGVTVSGQINVAYQNDDSSVNVAVGGLNWAAGQDSQNQVEYDIDATIKAPVNDYITATLGFQADHDTSIEDSANTRANSSPDTGDTQVDVTVANFTYVNGPVTAIVGKQNVGTPFLYDQKGDGVVALFNAGPVTLAAAHFVNSNAQILSGNTGLDQGAESINAVAAIAPNIAGTGINASAWYVTTTLGMATNANGADAYTVAVDGKIADMISLDLRHSSAEIDGKNGITYDAETLTKAVVGVDLGMVSLTAGYAMTNDTFDKNGGRLHGVSWDDDDTTATGFNGEQAYLDLFNDADAFLIGASSTFGSVTAGLTYIDGESGSNLVKSDSLDFSELILNASYAMSKNFTVASYYSMFEADYKTTGVNANLENDQFEVKLTYKF